MEETIGKASLRDAAIGTGIATDKMLALTGQTAPVLQIANSVLSTAEKERERRERHAKLDAIPRKLIESREPSAWRNPSDNFGRSNCVILARVYDAAGHAIETHEHAGEFKEW